MSRIFRDKSSSNNNNNTNTAKRQSHSLKTTLPVAETATVITAVSMPVYPIHDLESPFGDPGPSLSDSELRQSAYEILIAACRSTGSRPLTYIPQSEKADKAALAVSAPAPSLQRSLTSSAASKVKKALGMSVHTNFPPEGENYTCQIER